MKRRPTIFFWDQKETNKGAAQRIFSYLYDKYIQHILQFFDFIGWIHNTVYKILYMIQTFSYLIHHQNNSYKMMIPIILISNACASEFDTNFCDFIDIDALDLGDSEAPEVRESDPANRQVMKNPREPKNCLRGCSWLHFACQNQNGHPLMLELLLLQFAIWDQT